MEVFRWIHAKGAERAADMSSLSAGLREKLEAEWGPPIAYAEHIHRSSDGTRKIVARLADGATIETVLLPSVSGPKRLAVAGPDDDADDDEPTNKVRVTQCISTQVGCAMGCVFCASGVAGWNRHLAPEEIVGQVLLGRRHLDEK